MNKPTKRWRARPKDDKDPRAIEITAATWFQARQIAAVQLQLGPDQIDVRGPYVFGSIVIPIPPDTKITSIAFDEKKARK